MPSILITGGAGFIGVNSAIHFAALGWDVTCLDNLSRRGTEQNLQWLLAQHPAICFKRVDIRDSEAIATVVRELQPSMLLHLAAQVAVTTSYTDPREVYGGMESVPVQLGDHGYGFRDLPLGVPETQPLDFHSPYGCSKGVADQYTIDYARIYDLRTCAFRQSCIYGQRQFGIEDQGWVAWFSIASLLDRPITLYGDGWQTRDVLNVRDLARAYEAAWDHQAEISGQAFNIGGGPSNTLCLRDLLSFLEEELKVSINPLSGASRPGDQPVFVCDIRKAQAQLHWSPQIGVSDGVRDLIRWVRDNRELFSWLKP
jgi:CDP-paratose 2-epimerase